MTTARDGAKQEHPTAVYETRKFTVHEYYRMAEVGILYAKDRIELIRGDIVVMDRITPRHGSCKMKMIRALFLIDKKDAYVSVAHPVRLNQYSEPDPDLSILRLRKDEYMTGHPGPEDTLVAIEISDTGLAYVRNVKVNLYAESGVPEIWIMNLPEDCIEAFTGPGPDGYANHAIYRRGDRISPSMLTDVEFSVDDLLPPLPESADSDDAEAQGEGERQT